MVDKVDNLTLSIGWNLYPVKMHIGNTYLLYSDLSRG